MIFENTIIGNPIRFSRCLILSDSEINVARRASSRMSLFNASKLCQSLVTFSRDSVNCTIFLSKIKKGLKEQFRKNSNSCLSKKKYDRSPTFSITVNVAKRNFEDNLP